MKYLLSGEDEHLFHIKHEDGSTFSIAKNAVGPAVHKRIKALEPVKMADGGEVSSSDSQVSEPMGSDYADPQMEQTTEESPLVDPDRSPAAQDPSALYVEPAETPTENIPAAPAPVQSLDPTGMEGISGDYAKAFAQHGSGIEQMADAQAKAAKQQADVYKTQADQITKEQQRYEQKAAELDTEHSNLSNAVLDNKIDPNRMFHNMSTGNKIIAAIGVALSGIGSGLTGQPNMAMGVLQKSIDRDIDAQKAELGKSETLLSDNLRRTGNLNVATQMTRLQYNAVAQAKVAQIAAQSGSAMAQGQAKILLSNLGIQGAEMKRQLTMYKVMQDLNKGQGNPDAAISYLRMTNPQAAKEIEARYVPNVGIASIPVSDKVRDELTSRQSLQTSVQNLRDWSKKHEGSLNASDINYGNALAKSVQDEYRRANGQGVFREAEAEFVKGIAADNPTAFFNKYRTDPKYKALEDSNLMQLNSLKRSHGLPQQAPIQYKISNGIKYMRGPNGQAIQVK